MARYLGLRIAQAAIVLWAAYTVAYLILYLLPGDPLAIMLTASGIEADALSDEQLAQARAHYGLDRGFLEQYWLGLTAAVRGDFGQSLTKAVPVAQLLAERLPATFLLAGVAVVLSIIAGVGLASLAAATPWRPVRRVLSRLPAIGFSAPTFWIGLLLIQLFAFTLGWLPATGSDGWESLVLPAITLSIPSAAVYAQVLYKSLVAEQRQVYATTAAAKGLSYGEVQWRHVFRNAALPLLTLVGLQVGNTVSGATIVETVFARVGIGRLAQESVLAQDIPVVLGIVTVSAAAFVVVNLVVDLLYPLLDPRISHTAKVA